jgi:retron-type reverse transcriptase
MRRHNNLFPAIVTFENLELAARKAARGKRYTTSALRFRQRLEENLIALQNELIWGTYCPRPYRTFTVHEPKERLIHASAFRDRVVHHAILNVLEPVWDALFFEHSYACRRGKGTHAGVDHLTSMLQSAQERWPRVYALQADVARFFPSIDHHLLMGVVERKIKCRSTLDLLGKIVFATGDREDPESHSLPIGNLVSQWCANLYLNEVDRFVKHGLKCEYYTRYMDDSVTLHGSKAELWRVKSEIGDFLQDRLHLRLNPKTDIFPVSRGIDYLGYRTWADHRLLRRASSRRMSHRLRDLARKFAEGLIDSRPVQAAVASWVGHCSHCKSWNVRKRVLGSFVLRREAEC